ncbi:MAG: M3 family metallopeptidase [Candidatus Aminicenantes bacterium]|nr:M3 family metallopeptidase [Candidatus Aminicenantes bacterium]
MRNLLLILMATSLIIGLSFCSREAQPPQKAGANPLLEAFNTPYGVPPFDKIKEEHYLPAFEEAIKQHKKEIEKIVNNPDEPTFENTIEALDRSGELLRRVSAIFFNLLAANTNDKMQEIAKKVSPMLSAHEDEIYMNPKLFQRIKSVYEKREKLDLNTEQKTVLEKYYQDFVRGGANLDDQKKEELKKINQRLAVLTLKFGENVLKDKNSFVLVIDKKEDLAGLPENVIAAAAELAKKKGYDGKWVFTVDKPSMIPFLTYANNRALREKIFKAYTHLGNNNNEFDNKAIIKEIVNLRIKKAHIMGYKTYADFALVRNMAKTPENVYKLMDEIWKPALKKAKEERDELQKLIYEEGENFKLQPWDWWYYAEKLRKKKYALDEEMLRPYFKLDNVRKGAFYVANKLYGITFVERDDLPKYHPDVKAFEVKDANGNTIGIYYADYFPRPGKRSGAWMDAFRKEAKINGKRIIPVVYNVTNFSKPVGDKPALLSLEEVLTLFHEFGHALHELLSQCTYYRVSGTNVPIDFVELPSQFMENWAVEPAVMKVYAKHYLTGEPIPDELIEKIHNARHFNQGFATTEYLAAAYLDMDWHTLSEPADWDVNKFEQESMKKIGLIPEIVVRYRSTYFQHIFAGGYAAGYYSYIWAEVLDADAFHAFKEHGLFDRETAEKFRKFIIEKGGSDDPMKLYVSFRGKKPSIEPLLERRGLK